MNELLSCLLPANLKNVAKKDIWSPFAESLIFEKFSLNSSQKSGIKQFRNPPLTAGNDSNIF